MNVEMVTEAVQFPEKEFINGIFDAVQDIPHGTTAHTKNRRQNEKLEKL